MTLRIAFYRARFGDAYDKVTAVATLSKYSHCELVFSDGLCGSSSPRDDGVRVKHIDLNEHWHVFDVLDVDGYPISYAIEETIRFWFTLYDDNTYDWAGAIGSMVRLDFTSKNKKFCSYIAASVLGLDPIVSPGGLYRELKKNGMIQTK